MLNTADSHRTKHATVRTYDMAEIWLSTHTRFLALRHGLQANDILPSFFFNPDNVGSWLVLERCEPKGSDDTTGLNKLECSRFGFGLNASSCIVS